MNKKIFIFLFIITLFFTKMSPALGVDLNKRISTVKQTQRLHLSIYAEGLALVTEVRNFELPEGKFYVHYKDVAAFIEPDSVQILPLDVLSQVKIIEQNFRYDPINSRTLLKKVTGKSVILLEEGETKPEENFKEAKLISNNAPYVFQIGDEIHLGHPGRIVLPKMPENIFPYPTIIWLLESPKRQDVPFKVSYITKGITWWTGYNITFFEDGKRALINAWINVKNESGVSYPRTGLSFVSGEINKSIENLINRQEKPLREGMVDAIMPFIGKNMGEYQVYDLNWNTGLYDGEIKQISLFAKQNIPYKKKYIFKGRESFPLFRYNKGLKPKVKLFLLIENTPDLNSNLPLPDGRVWVYRQREDGEITLCGKDRVSITPVKQFQQIQIGTVSDIEGEHTQIDFKVPSRDVYEETFLINLKNYKDSEAQIEVIETLEGDWEILKNSHPFVKKDGSRIAFDVTLGPGAIKAITYTVKTKK